MLRSMFRVSFALAIALSMAFGVFSGFASAASQPTVAGGYNPVGSTPTGMGYCYPSGYNRNGWRCGWRLAMAPYNLGSYYGYNNGYYGYNNSYYNGYYGYYNGYYGTGGRNYNGYTGDYGGRPRFDPYYYNYGYNNYGYYNNGYYNNCNYYYYPYCN